MCECINEPQISEFISEVEQLEFTTQPDYDKLRSILRNLVINEK